MIKAILWDFDGTLVDSEEIWFEVVAEVFEKFGHKITPKIYQKYLGLTIEAILERLKVDLNIHISVDDFRAQITKKLTAHDIPLVDDAFATLSNLHKLGITMGVVTASHLAWNKPILIHHDIFQFFKFIVSQDDVDNNKPHPESYLKAIDLLQIPLDEIIVVEDSSVGITAAHDAGLRVIAKLGKFNSSEYLSDADYIINELKEVTKIVENLN